jgi:FkbM family methyltransferase
MLQSVATLEFVLVSGFNSGMNAAQGLLDTQADCRAMSAAESVLSALLRALPVKHGRHRLLDKIKPEHWPNTTTVVKTSYKGHQLLMDADDLVGWHFLMLKSFDPEVSEVLCAVGQASQRQVLWDIGANKGACAYAVATALPRSQIVLIEPQATLIGLLEHNMHELAPGRFEVHAVGVGVRQETLELVIPGDNKGRASLVLDVGTEDYRKVMVQMQTAQQIAGASAFGWPTLVKADVEGFEPQVFESLAPALTSRTCEAIVFENYAEHGRAFEQILGAVRPHGYQVFAIRKGLFSTHLQACEATVREASDYAVIRNDLLARPNLRKMLA